LELHGITFLEENHAQEISVESEKPKLRISKEIIQALEILRDY
jgi:hypothetical protein